MHRSHNIRSAKFFSRKIQSSTAFPGNTPIFPVRLTKAASAQPPQAPVRLIPLQSALCAGFPGEYQDCTRSAQSHTATLSALPYQDLRIQSLPEDPTETPLPKCSKQDKKSPSAAPRFSPQFYTDWRKHSPAE